MDILAEVRGEYFFFAFYLRFSCTIEKKVLPLQPETNTNFYETDLGGRNGSGIAYSKGSGIAYSKGSGIAYGKGSGIAYSNGSGIVDSNDFDVVSRGDTGGGRSCE